MTFQILKPNARDRSILETDLGRSLFTMGSFYEHNTFTSGVVYQREQLEDFMRRHGEHPFNLEAATIDNWTDTFANLLPLQPSGMASALVFVSRFEIPKEIPKLSEYSLYDAYLVEDM